MPRRGLLVALGCCIAHSQLQARAPSAGLGGNIFHTGLSRYAWNSSLPGARAKWNFSAGGRLFSTPVIDAEGTVYFGADRVSNGYVDGGAVFAVTASGDLLWTAELGGGLHQSAPAIDVSGTLFVATLGGVLFALDSTTGESRWAYQTNSGTNDAVTPLVTPNGSVIVASPSGTVVALSHRDSAVLWSFSGSSPLLPRIGAVYTPPALITVKSSGVRRATPLVVFGAMPHHAVALDSATGEMAWHTTLQGGFEAAPVVGPDGTVYMGCYDRRLYALDPDTGAIKWTFTATQPIVVPVALAADGTGLYLTSYDRMFYKLSFSGQQLWSYQVPGVVLAQPVVSADDTVYFGDVHHSLFALRGSDGTILWNASLGGIVAGSPVIGADGALYVGSGDGRLYAFEGCSGGLGCLCRAGWWANGSEPCVQCAPGLTSDFPATSAAACHFPPQSGQGIIASAEAFALVVGLSVGLVCLFMILCALCVVCCVWGLPCCKRAKHEEAVAGSGTPRPGGNSSRGAPSGGPAILPGGSPRPPSSRLGPPATLAVVPPPGSDSDDDDGGDSDGDGGGGAAAAAVTVPLLPPPERGHASAALAQDGVGPLAFFKSPQPGRPRPSATSYASTAAAGGGGSVVAPEHVAVSVAGEDGIAGAAASPAPPAASDSLSGRADYAPSVTVSANPLRASDAAAGETASPEAVELTLGAGQQLPAHGPRDSSARAEETRQPEAAPGGDGASVPRIARPRASVGSVASSVTAAGASVAHAKPKSAAAPAPAPPPGPSSISSSTFANPMLSPDLLGEAEPVSADMVGLTVGGAGPSRGKGAAGAEEARLPEAAAGGAASAPRLPLPRASVGSVASSVSTARTTVAAAPAPGLPSAPASLSTFTNPMMLPSDLPAAEAAAVSTEALKGYGAVAVGPESSPRLPQPRPSAAGSVASSVSTAGMSVTGGAAAAAPAPAPSSVPGPSSTFTNPMLSSNLAASPVDAPAAAGAVGADVAGLPAEPLKAHQRPGADETRGAAPATRPRPSVGSVASSVSTAGLSIAAGSAVAAAAPAPAPTPTPGHGPSSSSTAVNADMVGLEVGDEPPPHKGPRHSGTPETAAAAPAPAPRLPLPRASVAASVASSVTAAGLPVAAALQGTPTGPPTPHATPTGPAPAPYVAPTPTGPSGGSSAGEGLIGLVSAPADPPASGDVIHVDLP